MNLQETAIVLDRLATAYRIEVPKEALEVWSDHLAGVDPSVALDAAENVIGLEEFFPTVAVFNKEVAAVIRQRARDEVAAQARGEGGPSLDCPTCSGLKWYESDPLTRPNPATGEIEVFEQWRPCQRCAPIEHSRWLEHKQEVGAVRRHRQREESEMDLESVLAEAKSALRRTQPDEKAEVAKAHRTLRGAS